MSTFRNNDLSKRLLSRNSFKAVLNSNEPVAISFVNPFSYQIILESGELANKIDCWFVDGKLLSWFYTLSFRKILTRCSFDFSSIADDFFIHCEEKKLKIALIGGAESEIEAASSYLSDRYCQLKIQVAIDGFDHERIFSEVKLMANSGVDAVVIGLGTPFQEEIALLCKESGVPISITCGGFLTQTGIKGDYYHPAVKRFGLQWLQRMVLHKHVRARVIRDYPRFIIKWLINSELR